MNASERKKEIRNWEKEKKQMESEKNSLVCSTLRMRRRRRSELEFGGAMKEASECS